MHEFPKFRKLSLVGWLLVSFTVALFGIRQGHANAPPGRYTVADLTVGDTRTGLVWERQGPAAAQTSANAATYCQNSTLENAQWRLPTMKELQTLVDESQSGPSIDVIAFPGTPAGEFWTSSTVGSFPILNWTINFVDGDTSFGSGTKTAYVRCVRLSG
ncbi:MAG TPA: DUF1566 domain-containing protein [Polyangium sp.]|nr:DUF1566 domain-containing protein [Polyangium sp.]